MLARLRPLTLLALLALSNVWAVTFLAACSADGKPNKIEESQSAAKTNPPSAATATIRATTATPKPAVATPKLSREGADTPEGAVIAMIEAIDAGDQNGFLDVLDPELRAEPLAALLFQNWTLGAFGLGTTFEPGAVDFRDVSTSLNANSDGCAVVAVSARMRLAGQEQPLSDEGSVRRIGDRWFVSNADTCNISAQGSATVSSIGQPFLNGDLATGRGSSFVADGAGTVFVAHQSESYGPPDEILSISSDGTRTIVDRAQLQSATGFTEPAIDTLSLRPSGGLLFGVREGDYPIETTSQLMAWEGNALSSVRRAPTAGVRVIDSTGNIFFLADLEETGARSMGIITPDGAVRDTNIRLKAMTASPSGGIWGIDTSNCLVELDASGASACQQQIAGTVEYVWGFAVTDDERAYLTYHPGNEWTIYSLNEQTLAAVAGSNRGYADGPVSSAQFLDVVELEVAGHDLYLRVNADGGGGDQIRKISFP